MNVLERIRSHGRGRSDDQDFSDRYERGAPWEGYSDQEVLDRYQQAVSRLTPAEFERAAQWALERCSPQDRLLFGQYLHQQAQQQGVRVPDLEEADSGTLFRDTHCLARALRGIQQHQPDMLDQLLGSGGGTLDSPLAKAVLAGIVASAATNPCGGQR